MVINAYHLTSHTHSGVPVGRSPQLQYDQVVPWMQRKEVPSPVINMFYKLFLEFKIKKKEKTKNIITKNQGLNKAPEKLQMHIPRHLHLLSSLEGMHLQISRLHMPIQ